MAKSILLFFPVFVAEKVAETWALSGFLQMWEWDGIALTVA